MLIKQILEFRGMSENLTKNQKKYYVLNFEGENGEGCKFITFDNNFATNLQKGVRYIVSFNVDGNLFLKGITLAK